MRIHGAVTTAMTTAEMDRATSAQQAAEEQRGIIVIGGDQAHAAAAPSTDAIKQRPMLGGIIIVGGIDPFHALAQPRTDDTIAGGAPQGDEGRDRLANFAIQQLMSAFNHAEALASNVQRKSHEATSDILRNLV